MKIFYHMSIRVQFRTLASALVRTWSGGFFFQRKLSSNDSSSPTVRKSLLSTQSIVVLYPEAKTEDKLKLVARPLRKWPVPS